MLAKGAKETVNSSNTPQIHESHEQIVIHREVITGINISSLFKQAPPPETCFLRNEIPPLHQRILVRRENPIPDDSVIFINRTPVTINAIHVRVLFKKFRHKMKSA